MPFHIVFSRDENVEIFTDLVVRNDEIVEFPFDTHKKYLEVGINMLVKVGDIDVVFKNKFADRGNNTFVIRTVNQEDSGGSAGLGN